MIEVLKMKNEYASMNLLNSPQPRMSRKLAFAVTFALFFCAVFAFAAEVRANGDPYVDWPPQTEPTRRPARRAPIRRPPQQRAPVQEAPQIVEPPPPPQPSALETGIRMMEQMRYNQARTWLQRAVQEERDNPYAWFWFGKAHHRIGNFQQAQIFYRRAIELDPGFAPFARIVTYPDHGGRIPLWDPLRPARVFPIELSNRGISIVPPDAPEAGRRPTAPPVHINLPGVPVYIPPAPDAVPQAVTEPLHFQWLPPEPVYIPPPPPAPDDAAPVLPPH